jgi:branched-chain amino acid transport system substrate-binding protein
MRIPRSKPTLTILSAVALVALAACTEAPSSSKSSSSASSSDVKGVLHADKASGEPIKLGFLDPSQGPTAQPEAGLGAQGAVDYINNYHGGLRGRPIDLVSCKVDVTPESLISCANTFVQKGVVAVTEGFTLGDGAALPILNAARIPLVGYSGASLEAVFSQTSYFFGPAVGASAVAPFQYFKKNGAKSVAYIFGDIPAYHDYVAKQFDPIAKKLGINFKPVFYDLSNVNWTTIAASLIATHADVIGVPTLSEDQCTDLVRALQAQGYHGDALVGNCTDFASKLSLDSSINAYSLSGLWISQAYDAAPADAQKQLDIFRAAMKDSGHGDVVGTSAVPAFSTLVTLTDILTGSKAQLTPSGISAAVKGATDAPVFLGATATCDHSLWPGEAACGNSVLLLKAQKNGSFAPATKPPFTTVDAAILH